jgi:hypothetical protein
VNRLVIGYSPVPEEVDRPVMVFVETAEGVIVQNREGRAPRLLNQPERVRQNGETREVRPGEPAYFDIVVDNFSTRVFVRNVTELEPEVIASMLVSEDNWDLLPRAARGLAIH